MCSVRQLYRVLPVSPWYAALRYIYVDDYNFLYYILEPGTRWIDENKTMKVVENLVELSAAAAPQPIPVEDSDQLHVDDYNFLYYILEPGTRWIDENETMKVVENLFDQDKEVPEDVRSMDEIVKMAKSICSILQFTGDCPGANTEGKLPILDICCWIKNNQVIFEHYRKPIASSLLITQRSAMPDRVKRAAITHMAIKILENTSQDVPWKRKV